MKLTEDTSLALARRVAEAQEIRITNGPIVAVMEGRITAWEALRDAAERERTG